MLWNKCSFFGCFLDETLDKHFFHSAVSWTSFLKKCFYKFSGLNPLRAKIPQCCFARGDPSEHAPAGPGASASYYFTSYNKTYYNSGGTTCAPLLVHRAFEQTLCLMTTFVMTSISTHVVLKCIVLC